ncbi:MliC family protein [Modicisalibacter radicis]|uniref:MliC family protein n=1 Tax=Halomonas sp. EAR18 TaxID=2518972 RepID=UPI00109D0B7A|nr:MliC family protein [Halomonas sp. EAR18]
MRIVSLLGAAVLLAGCAGPSTSPSTAPTVDDLAERPPAQVPEPQADTPRDEPRSPLLPSAFFADGAEAFIAWRCTPAQDLIAAFPDDHLRLWSGQGHYRLERAVVASGTRYVKDDLTFWSKGERAMVESDNGRLECQQDIRRQTLTRADHPQSIFHALGNEPGWMLDLDRDSPRMTLVTDYGDERRTLDYRLVDLENGRQASVTLRSGDAAEPVTVHLEARACFDAMSGQPYPVRVRVETPERTLRGCGQGIERP